MEVIKFGKLGLKFKTGDANDLRNKINLYFEKNLKLNQKIRLRHLKEFTERNSNQKYLKILNNI